MKGYIAAEDPVTFGIIHKILGNVFPEFEIITELPARGGQVKSMIKHFNTLSETNPVILLTDLDNCDCAPRMLYEMLGTAKNDRFIFNIAVDEAEAWLMADRQGFAEYFRLDESYIPNARLTRQGGRIERKEMDFRYKSSLFFGREIICNSSSKELIDQLTPKNGAKKGPEYNSVMLPFISEKWNIESACLNSDSLQRMVSRIRNLRQISLAGQS